MLGALNSLLQGSRSLRRTLIWLYSMVMVLLVTSVTVFAYLTHRSSVEVHATRVLWETSQRISEVFEDYLAKVDLMLNVAYPLDVGAAPDLNDETARTALVERFWQATGLFPAPYDHLFFGTQNGQLISISHQGGPANLIVRWDLLHRSTYYRDAATKSWELETDREAYPNDVRALPWFLAGRRNARLTWTAPYLSLLEHELVVARVRSISSPKGQPDAVIGAEIPLKALDDFTRQLHISPSGLAFVVEPNGAMIASTDQESVTGEIYRRYAQDYPVQTIREVFQEVSRQYDLAQLQPDSPEQIAMNLHGQRYNVFFRALLVGDGLRWVVVTAAPLSDFSSELSFYLLIGGGILLILGGSLLLSSRIANWITYDIRRLSNSVRLLGEGGTSIDFQVNRQDEIGQLSKALQQMHSDLNTDPLTGLCSRSGLLRQLEQAVRRQRDGASGFALLFMDLNGFKAINDTYGHDAGDLALIEVAERLRSAVRQGDLVARLSGDEFVAVLWRVEDEEVAGRVSQQIIKQLCGPLSHINGAFHGEQVRIGTAIGLAICPQDGSDVETLLHVADQAMYEHKLTLKRQEADELAEQRPQRHNPLVACPSLNLDDPMTETL